MHRIIHLDCKGAPLKISYMEQVLLLAKSWGATGFLMEWEDTFPYFGDIEDIGSLKNSGGDEMYSMEEVQHIFQFARNNGLEAIQLVQTIGHMEFVLKHPAFIPLREVPSSPAVLCPTKKESQAIVRMMLDQALDAQPDARYFHIGADEVWHRGECLQCRTQSANTRFQGDGLFLQYIQDLNLYIKKKRPDLTVLMWDDMLRSIDENVFKAYLLPNIQPVYWNYNTLDHFQTDMELWKKYKRMFPKMWAGSAFKGANGSNQALSPVARYVSNHDAWIRELNIVEFAGIILTGWSRYDHFATLCELMPVMLPSLASCLRLLCKSAELPRDQLVSDILPSQEWPGEELARSVHSYITLRERCINLLNGELVATWLNPWQLERNYTVSVHVQPIAYSAHVLSHELKSLNDTMSVQLGSITGRRSLNEWLRSNLVPLLRKISALFITADAAMKRDAGVRPYDI